MNGEVSWGKSPSTGWISIIAKGFPTVMMSILEEVLWEINKIVPLEQVDIECEPQVTSSKT